MESISFFHTSPLCWAGLKIFIWWNSICWKFNLGIWWNSVRPKVNQRFKTNFFLQSHDTVCSGSSLPQSEIKSVVREIWINSGLSLWHFWMTSFVYTMILCTCVAHSSLSHSSTNANFIGKLFECMAKEISRKYHDTASEINFSESPDDVTLENSALHHNYSNSTWLSYWIHIIRAQITKN